MIRVTKDGRTIKTDGDYTSFRKEMYDLQGGRCDTCGWKTRLHADIEQPDSFHVHHTNGRGGGRRDDTANSCIGICGDCHQKKHGQGRGGEPQWSRSRLNLVSGEQALPDHLQRGVTVLSKCEHGMYNGGRPGEPAEYCTGCTPPGKLSPPPPASEEVDIDLCPSCGVPIEENDFLFCFNCRYEANRNNCLDDLETLCL